MVVRCERKLTREEIMQLEERLLKGLKGCEELQRLWLTTCVHASLSSLITNECKKDERVVKDQFFMCSEGPAVRSTSLEKSAKMLTLFWSNSGGEMLR